MFTAQQIMLLLQFEISPPLFLLVPAPFLPSLCDLLHIECFYQLSFIY